MTMKKEVLQLDGPWEFKEFPENARRMRDLGRDGWKPAQVPSSIFTCLKQVNAICPNELSANPEQFHWVSDRSWIFRKTFDVSDTLIKKERLKLIFEGLDTVAHVWLNGKLIGKVENMFIPHCFDVTACIQPSGNTLHVKFFPALQRADQLMQRYGKLSEHHHFGDARRCYLRKAQYQFGSALTAAMTGCGIFRSVRLEGADRAQLGNLHVRTVDCSEHEADIRIAVQLDRVNGTEKPLKCVLTITGGGLQQREIIRFEPREDRHTVLLRIDRPILWWPRNYGVQHQYQLTAELLDDNVMLDRQTVLFGIRTLRVNRNADKHGHAFQFEINGTPIKIKGANWMPLSIFPGEKREPDYTAFLNQAAEAHINMLRVWGGGLYEHPAFYERCDKLGILVWQDFMFATAYYPDRQWFTDIVRHEARSVITRLRNHPSLALWCGNSRIDSLHQAACLGSGRKFFGKAIYHSLLPGLLNELDPDRDYIPTTPFSESPQSGHDATDSGSTHHWDVWERFTEKDQSSLSPIDTGRFVAEVGLQSLPDQRTVCELTAPALPVTTGSPALEKHNYQPGGPSRIARYIAGQFPPTLQLAQYIRQSQLAQARAVKHYIEQLRCQPDINAGALLWTWNDSLPCVSFSAVDTKGRPKALYYYARRFFAPILVALRYVAKNNGYSVVVVNDSLKRITATLHCRILDNAGSPLDEMEIPVALSPGKISNPYPLAKSFAQLYRDVNTFLHLALTAANGTLAENSYVCLSEKYNHRRCHEIDLQISPHLTDERSWIAKLSCHTPVRDVQLIAPVSAQIDDNFFMLLPGQTKEVRITFNEQIPCSSVPIEILT